MFDRSRIYEVSIPVGIFVLVLLLFPAAHGSFVATHGPVTALRALRAATAVFFAIASLHILLMIRAAARHAAVPFASPFSCHSAAADREHTCSLLC